MDRHVCWNVCVEGRRSLPRDRRVAGFSYDGRRRYNTGRSTAGYGNARSARQPGGDNGRLTLRLEDPGGRRNYYLLRFYSLQEYNGKFYRYQNPLDYEGPDAIELLGGGYSRDIIFNDAMFDGRSWQLLLKTFVYDQGKYELDICNLSEETYRYMQTMELQRRKRYDRFSEKVSIYNNIRNGLGIVGGMAVKTLPVAP